ncbi:MAG TPA: hypothetical protein VFQ22_03205, partial [Longimicrobiales bacterium]|nr:hypothetical protein [Longimicrobiales bacterium]
MAERRVLAVALALAVPAVAHAQSMRELSMSRQLDDDGPVGVDVRYAAGTFQVRSMEEGLLYRMNLRYDEERFEPVAEYEPGRLEVGVESIARRRLRGPQSGALTLELARGVPMDLDLELGAVKADLDLGGLALTGLELSTG